MENLIPGSTKPYVVVLEGIDKGRIFALDEGPNIFGRNPESNITLRDQKMSRSHGIFYLNGGEVSCEDLRSTNGIFVDGQPIQMVALDFTSRVRIGDTLMKIAVLTEAEVQAHNDTETAATIDPLTSIYNRNGFQMAAEIDMAKLTHLQQNCSILILDIDFFKKLNDELGHAAGDSALREFSRRVASQLREGDHFMRYGGEEFVIMLANTSADIVAAVAERIRSCIAETPFDLGATQRVVTVSIGVYTAVPAQGSEVNNFIKCADKALYRAKELGRNRVEVYE